MSESNEIPVVRVENIQAYAGQEVRLQGWLFNRRGSSKVQFIHLRDGSGFIQCVMGKNDVDEEMFARARSLSQETAIIIQGRVNEEERAPYCGHEIHAESVEIVSTSENYPITKKPHGDAFLMDHRHLWLRSLKQNLILRVRATLVKAIRDYFDNNGFLLMDSPIFTPNACEGTSTLFETDWFDDRKAYLSQSGQLYQEATAMAFGKTYCFGPTFRAEKSKTRRHLNEFWMVEPEVAFMDLEGNMALAEDFLRTVVLTALEKHGAELEKVLERDLSILKNIAQPFTKLSYDEAILKIQELQAQCEDEEERKMMEIEWGMDFGGRHETLLTQQYDTPVIIYNFPSQVKAFYMKKNPERPEVALCLDVLAPEGCGEIIGGGQREDNLELLLKEIERHQLDPKDFGWYLDLRKYGSVPHGGFGLGLERLVGWVCGVHHVRETIPFARTLDRLSP